MLLAAPLAAGLAAAAVSVESAAPCPAADAVSARLEALLPGPPGGAPAGHASIERRGEAIHVALRRPDGTLLGERHFDAAHRCEDLAEAAAVVIAAWGSDPGGGIAVAAPPPAALRAAAPAVRPTGSNGAPSWGRPQLELGVGLGSAWAAGRPDWALAADLQLSPAGGPVGVRISALLPGRREPALGAGRVGWRRSHVALGPAVSRALGPVSLQAAAAAAAAWLRVEGLDYPQRHRHDDLQLGATAALRAAWRRARLAPYVELGGGFWPKRAVALFQEREGLVLPRIQLWATIGGRLGP